MQSHILGVEPTGRNGYPFKFILYNGMCIYIGKCVNDKSYITIKHHGNAVEYLVDRVAVINGGFKYALVGPKKKLLLYEYRMNNRPREFALVDDV